MNKEDLALRLAVIYTEDELFVLWMNSESVREDFLVPFNAPTEDEEWEAEIGWEDDEPDLKLPSSEFTRAVVRHCELHAADHAPGGFACELWSTEGRTNR